MNFLKTNKILIHIFILAAVTATVYFGNFSNSFSYTDDYKEIVTNKLVNPAVSDALEIFTDINSFHFYVPLKHFANYWLNIVSYFNPHVSHLASDILHVFNVILCYLVILKLSKSYRIAFLTALFFAVAPVGSNAVNEIAARGHLFTAFFGLSSFLCYMLADSAGLKHNQDKHFIALSFILYFIGLFFWPTIIVLPVLFLVYEVIRHPESRITTLRDRPVSGSAVSIFKGKMLKQVQHDKTIKKIFFRLLPFAIAAIAVAALNLYISHLRHAEETQSAVFDNGMILFFKLFGWSSIYKVPYLAGQYLFYSFVPPFFDIVFAPPLFPFWTGRAEYLLKIGLLDGFAALCILAYFKNKMSILSLAIFAAFLFPGMFVMYKTELISLRYMYFASIGVFFGVFAFLEYYVFPKIKTSYAKGLAALALGLWFAFFSVNSFVRKHEWRNPQSVTNAMLENKGLAEVWGWVLKIKWEPDLEGMLKYLYNAKAALEKNKAGYELQYDLVNQNIEGRIAYINKVSAKTSGKR
ncbi:MAG: hypothetical protein FWC57_06370 [Endomicrobia bacterium]|nr:hypothetical protein [Endomicrobiia bacterium]